MYDTQRPKLQHSITPDSLRNPFADRGFGFLEWLAKHIDQSWTIVRQCFFQHFPELVRFGNAPALYTEGGGNRCMIGDREIHRKLTLIVP